MAQPLSNEQVAAFRKRLRTRHAELVEEIRRELLQSDNEHYIELAGAVHDPGEESVADLLSDLATDAVDRHVREIRDLEDALQRAATGTYGLCVDCAGPIELERLEAYPAARRCYTCQRKHEQAYDKAGGAKL